MTVATILCALALVMMTGVLFWVRHAFTSLNRDLRIHLADMEALNQKLDSHGVNSVIHPANDSTVAREN